MHSEIDGQDLLDPVLLVGHIRATADYWGGDHLGDLTAAFWYGLSQVLLDPLVVAAVRPFGSDPDATADPRQLRLHRHGHFFTDAVRVPGPTDDQLGLQTLIAALSQVSGSAPAVFRAIAGDSLGSRLLFNAPSAPLAELLTLAEQLATRIGLPVPRLASGSRGPVLLRSSCCRLFRLPRGALCMACPRRTAQERAAVLGVTVTTLG